MNSSWIRKLDIGMSSYIGRANTFTPFQVKEAAFAQKRGLGCDILAFQAIKRICVNRPFLNFALIGMSSDIGAYVKEAKHPFHFELVQPIREDGLLIMEWRNDPQTLANSYHTTPKVEIPFLYEFFTEYFCFPQLPPLFAVKDGKRVAFLKFEPCEDFAFTGHGRPHRCCALSINVAPEFRGKGIGSALLKAIQPWVQQQGFESLYGEVKVDNHISRKAFLNARFRELPEVIKMVDERLFVPIVRYVVDFGQLDIFSRPVLIIAEAGSNWRMGSYERDLAMAQTLIDIAAEARADVVKFQVFRPETIYAKNAGSLASLKDAGVHESMENLFSDLMMPYEMIAELHARCQAANIGFMATPFSKEDFAAVDPFVLRHKIASYELNHPHLLTLAAQSQKPLILSTGASTESEIAWAVQTLREHGCYDLTLLQCTAQYPAIPSSLNLNALVWLKNRFQVKVGLSDHSLDPICAPVSAVALGASVIEKHFTLDRRLPGPDHAFAVMPNELKRLVEAVRLAEQMGGSYMKCVDPTENELRDFARRGLQALRDIAVGETFKEGKNVGILRPGQRQMGIHPKYLVELEGKPAKRSITAGDGILFGDW